VKFCMHDIGSNTHNPTWFETETAQKKESAIDNVESRQICILREFDFEISSDYFKLLEEAFQDGESKVVYTDFSALSEHELVSNQIRLPSWSQERFLSIDYLGPLIAVDLAAISSLKESKSEITRSSIMLACIEHDLKVEHLAEIGYSVPFESFQESTNSHYAEVQCFLTKTRPGSIVEKKVSSWNVVSNKGIAPNLISIIIPTRGAKKSSRSKPLVVECIRSIASQNLGSSSLEILVVYDTDTSTKYLNEVQSFETESISIRAVSYDPPFNFSRKCNLGAQNASGEVIIFLNDDTLFRSADSILELAGTAMICNVGAVGAKLFFENERLQHAGYILRKGFVGHAYFRDRDGYGPFGDLVVPHEVVGVTGACFAQQKSVWIETGGWDESLPAAYNDVDYCFRIRSYGYSIIQNNLAKLFHYESITRNPVVKPEETALILARWKDAMTEEPFFRTEVMNDELRHFQGTLIQEYSRYIQKTYRHAGISGVVRIFANGFKKLMRVGN
jgi:GT2 family glycosyltransferase